jgi:hypothetical protein
MPALMVSPESTVRCVVECSPALLVSRCCSKVVVRRDDFLRIWARCFSLARGVAAFRARIVSDFARRAVPTFRATPYHEGSIVPESALGAPHGCCPACGATSRRTRVGVLQREPIVELLRCGVCGASAASRFPTEEWLMAWYARYYGDHKTGVTFTGFERFAAHIEPHVQVPLSAPLRILDFGSGDGALAIAIAKRWLDLADSESGRCSRPLFAGVGECHSGTCASSRGDAEEAYGLSGSCGSLLCANAVDGIVCALDSRVRRGLSRAFI